MTGRLGVLSDTHLPKPSGLPKRMLAAFEGVDAILHAGDVTALDELAPLMAVAPVYVVMGNNDPPEMSTRFGWRRALRWRGWRIGLVHGDVGRGRTTPQKARTAFVESPPRWEEVAGRSDAVPAPTVMGFAAVPEGRPRGHRLETPLDGPFDCVIFGHSHQPHCALDSGVLLLNPGSPTERRREPRASFVVIEAGADDALEVRFHYL